MDPLATFYSFQTKMHDLTIWQSKSGYPLTNGSENWGRHENIPDALVVVAENFRRAGESTDVVQQVSDIINWNTATQLRNNGDQT